MIAWEWQGDTLTVAGDVERPIYKVVRRETPGGGETRTRELVAKRRARIQLSIDVGALLEELGGLAALAKTKRARARHGALLAKLIGATDTPVEEAPHVGQ